MILFCRELDRADSTDFFPISSFDFGASIAPGLFKLLILFIYNTQLTTFKTCNFYAEPLKNEIRSTYQLYLVP